MFGIGFLELCVIAAVSLIVVGPTRLPELMRQAGRFFVHARRMTNEVKSTFDDAIRKAEEDIHMEELRKIRNVTSNLQETARKATEDLLGTETFTPPQDGELHSSAFNENKSQDDKTTKDKSDVENPTS